MGDYPVGANANVSTGTNSFLRAALAPNGANSLNTLNKVYFDFSKGMGANSTVSTDTNQDVIDPFGNRYGYQYPGNATRSGTNFFDLWSTAGSANTNQWIKNW
jgi:hypothetical protein